MRRILLSVLMIMGLAMPCAAGELWLYCSTNLLVDANIDKLDALFARAQKAGYTHVMLGDYKFARLGEMTDRYFRNVDRVKKLAVRDRLELVPAVFDVGHSNPLLGHNPNLAEGVPVLDTPLVVKDGKLVVDAEPIRLGEPSWADDAVRPTEGGVMAVADNPAHARFVHTLKLPKNRCFHVGVKVKTDGYTGRPEVKVLAGEETVLSYSYLGVKRTQDWAEHHVVFNTGDHAEVRVYFGVWDAARGRLQWRDGYVEEVAFVNVLRREGTPVALVDEAGQPVPAGMVDEVVDPLLGNQPWPGEYTVWHRPPSIGTKLAEGTKLRASWYYPPIIFNGQVEICPSEKQTLAALADQFKRVDAAFGAAGYMMNHDEIRVWNTCRLCVDRHLSAGELLADNARACEGMLEGRRAYIWSDMFDPHHNAVADYYLVRGDFAGAWTGLSPQTVIVNWNHDRRDDSLAFFRGRGHRQLIAAYYDDPSLDSTRVWLQSTKGDSSVVGYMYTTWEGDYTQLEQFAELCK